MTRQLYVIENSKQQKWGQTGWQTYPPFWVYSVTEANAPQLVTIARAVGGFVKPVGKQEDGQDSNQ